MKKCIYLLTFVFIAGLVSQPAFAKKRECDGLIQYDGKSVEIDGGSVRGRGKGKACAKNVKNKARAKLLEAGLISWPEGSCIVKNKKAVPAPGASKSAIYFSMVDGKPRKGRAGSFKIVPNCKLNAQQVSVPLPSGAVIEVDDLTASVED